MTDQLDARFDGGCVIRSAYERLFVAFYGWSLKVDGKKGAYNVGYASIMLSMVLLMNIASIAMIVDALIPQSFLWRVTQISRAWWVVFLVAFVASQYLYFRHGQRYQLLVTLRSRGQENLGKESHGKLLSYILASVILVIALLILRLK